MKKNILDQVSFDDTIYLVLEGGFSLLAGLILAPFAAAVWGGGGLIAFVINMIMAQFNKPIYRSIGEYLSIAGGIYIFWWMKLATLPGIDGSYIPFSALIPRIPDSFDQPLIIGVPILIGLISFLTAWSTNLWKTIRFPH